MEIMIAIVFSIFIRVGEDTVSFFETLMPINTIRETNTSEPEWKASANNAKLPESTANKSFKKTKNTLIPTDINAASDSLSHLIVRLRIKIDCQKMC